MMLTKHAPMNSCPSRVERHPFENSLKATRTGSWGCHSVGDARGYDQQQQLPRLSACAD